MKKNIYTLTFIIIILDQVIKNIVLKTIELGEIISVIPNFFFITSVKNTGGAWSILNNHTFILTLISFACIIFLNQYLAKKNTFNKIEVSYYGLIMGGMIGNFIDRLLYEGVIDFLGFKFGNYQFPIFNIADIAIVIGVGLVLIETIRGDINEFRSTKRKY